MGNRETASALCSDEEASLAGLLPWAVQTLAGAGIESAGFEARLLLAQALQVSRVKVIAATYPPPSAAQLDRFIRLVRRRAQRMPLAYLRGDQEFYGLPFRVTSAVLIPRPETELLVDFAIREYKSRPALARPLPTDPEGKEALLPSNFGGQGALLSPDLGGRDVQSESVGGGVTGRGDLLPPDLGGRGTLLPPDLGGRGGAFTLADVGTGSGCIAISILVSCSQARAVAYDLSGTALALARYNAHLNEVADRLRLVRGDLLTSSAAGQFDLIISNPPYIPTGDLDNLQPEVRDYEPRLALDGGASGMDCYARIAADAARALKPDGLLLLEVGQGQAQAVADLLWTAGYDDVRAWPDLAGIDRVVGGRRAGA